jgi:ABC-type glutathione transport system ATPase component
MGAGTLFWAFLCLKNLYMMTPAKMDNMLSRIDSNKELSVQMKDIKSDVESSAKTMDKAVKDEAVKAKNIIAGIQAAETITVSDLQKYYIITPEGQNVDETEYDKRFKKRQKIEGKQEIKRALDGISFSVKENETLAILGIEGVGKSSIFNCLTTNLKMSWGNIHYGKTDVADCL